MHAEFIRSHQEAPEIWSFFFTKPSPFHFVAGDYTEVALRSEIINDKRWLSVASAPHEKHLQFTVKIPTENPSRFKRGLQLLTQGETILLSPALGNFNLPLQPAQRLLFIAGGIGITPYRSIIVDYQQQTQQTHDIILCYIARKGQHLFLPVFQNSSIQLVTKARQAKETKWSSIAQLVDDWRERIIYLSGPEPMMTDYYDHLLQTEQLEPRQIRLDYFPGYSDV
jgi:ferredoxin-NADP reductase